MERGGIKRRKRERRSGEERRKKGSRGGEQIGEEEKIRRREEKKKRGGRDFWRDEGLKEWNREECFSGYRKFRVSFFSIGISIFSPILLLSFFFNTVVVSFYSNC